MVIRDGLDNQPWLSAERSKSVWFYFWPFALTMMHYKNRSLFSILYGLICHGWPEKGNVKPTVKGE